MKFPFFKGQKPEQKPTTTVFVPPRAVTNKPTPPAPVVPLPPMPVGGGDSVPLRLSSILSQLPRDLFQNEHRAQLANLTLSVPSRLVLPQLSSGKVSIALADLAPAFPANVLNRSVLATAGQHPVLLPLQEMIASLPPEAFKVKHEAEISMDEPELATLPALFDEEATRRAEAVARKAVAIPTPIEEPAAIPAAAAPPSPAAPARAMTAPAPVRTPEPVTAATPAVEAQKINIPSGIEIPTTVQVSLRSLVNNMPEKLFVCPKADLWQQTDLDVTVPLPLEPILSQIQSARVTVPIKNILPLIPAAILVQPTPLLDTEVMVVPLYEVIPQLPPELFTAQLSATRPQDQQAIDADIPAPFQERAKPAPLPAKPVEPEKPAVVSEVTEKQLEEEMPIFSEKHPSRLLSETTRIQLPADLAARAKAASPSPVAPAPGMAAVPVAPPERLMPPAPVEPPKPVEPVAPVAPVVAEPIKPVEPPAPAVELPAAPVPTAVPEPIRPVAQEPETQPLTEAPAIEEDEAVSAEIAEEEALAAGAGSLDERKFLININRCTVEDLLRIEGVGRKLAQRIIEFRTNHGHISSIEELRLVPGVGRKTYRALAGVESRSLNRLLGVPDDRELTLQEVIKLTGSLKGIEGCMLAMSDGLFLTGQLPAGFDQEAISVFAPQLFKKMGRYVKELGVGQVRRFTLFTDERPISIFRAADVYLIIIHDTRHFSKRLLRQCERISQEIARLCRQRTVV